MNRRGFLRSIFGGAAFIALRPDLLYEPSRVMISTYVPEGLALDAAAMQTLADVTRRAFLPQVVLQIYKSTPLLSAMLENSTPISGGLSPITSPLLIAT